MTSIPREREMLLCWKVIYSSSWASNIRRHLKNSVCILFNVLLLLLLLLFLLLLLLFYHLFIVFIMSRFQEDA